jgi:ABC-type transporter lipoprotein component MlaA
MLTSGLITVVLVAAGVSSLGGVALGADNSAPPMQQTQAQQVQLNSQQSHISQQHCLKPQSVPSVPQAVTSHSVTTTEPRTLPLLSQQTRLPDENGESPAQQYKGPERQAEQQQTQSGEQPPPDPLAPVNHRVLGMNAKLDNTAFHPVASGWAKAVPKPARQCIHRFFDNVAFVHRFTNAVFQLKVKDAGGELARFGINSTVGLAGLFDPADKWFGISEHDNDFGKTLATWGMPGGWFVVMPVAGPVNVRNALGHFVDGAMNPMNYLVPGSGEVYETVAHSIEGVNERAEDLDKFEGVPTSDKFHPVTLDSPALYEAVRANYLQKQEQRAGAVGAASAGAAAAGATTGGAGQAGTAAVGTAPNSTAKINE